jgi:phosphoglycolate phosphatase
LKRAIFFDFDGTLAHTAPDMVASLHCWQKENGQQSIDFYCAQEAVSGGARALLALAGVSEESPLFAAARARFLTLYEESGYANTVLFSGMADTLEALAADGWAWGVVTNKPRRYFSPIAVALRLASPALVAGDDCVRAKPAPDTLFHAASIVDVPPERCLYVGDDRRDAQAAQAAGMGFIAAGWGYWPASEWKQMACCVGIATTPQTLPALIRTITAGNDLVE